MLEKTSLLLLTEEGEKEELLNMPNYCIVLNRVSFWEKIYQIIACWDFYQSLAGLGEENNQFPPIPTILPYLSGGKNWDASLNFRIQSPRLSERPKPNHRAMDYSFPTLYHVTKGLFIGVPFIQYIMCGYQEKHIKHTKRQKIRINFGYGRDVGMIRPGI